MRTLYIGLALLAVGCGHWPLSPHDLDRAVRPAFISRIEDDAGPRSNVFRGDGAYGGKLKKLDPREADRRLALKLQKGVSRFEVSDRLRAQTLSLLPAEQPWTQVVDPAEVATVLESFLVEEVPANPPDYDLLEPLGADTVVEFVVEEYGMRSSGGKAGAYMKGYARMFFIGGGQVWYRRFHEDDLDAKRPHLDPFKVARDPNLFRERIVEMGDRLGTLFAKDLSPARRARHAPEQGTDELKAPPDDTNRTGKPAPTREDELPPGELPPPDDN